MNVDVYVEQAKKSVPVGLTPEKWIEVYNEKLIEIVVREVVSICDTEKADYFKNRKAAYDFEEKNIYAEGEAACDTIKYKVKHRFGVKR